MTIRPTSFGMTRYRLDLYSVTIGSVTLNPPEQDTCPQTRSRLTPYFDFHMIPALTLHTTRVHVDDIDGTNFL